MLAEFGKLPAQRVMRLFSLFAVLVLLGFAAQASAQVKPPDPVDVSDSTLALLPCTRFECLALQQTRRCLQPRSVTRLPYMP